MTVMEAIGARKSIRAYEGRCVEEEKLRLVLEAGRLAPSASNAQEWKFVVAALDGEESRRAVVDACNGQQFVGGAPLVLAVCATKERMMPCGQPAHTVDCSIALSFMMLEAAALGLGTCWLGNFSAEKARAVFGLSESESVVAVTPLGYPAAPGRERARKTDGEIVVRR